MLKVPLTFAACRTRSTVLRCTCFFFFFLTRRRSNQDLTLVPATDLLDPPPTPFVFNYENLSFETPSLYGPTRPKPNSRRKKKRLMRLPETDLGATVVSRRWGVLKNEKKKTTCECIFPQNRHPFSSRHITFCCTRVLVTRTISSIQLLVISCII